jgi:hypothetical protein
MCFACWLQVWWKGKVNMNQIFLATSYGALSFPGSKLETMLVTVDGDATTLLDCDDANVVDAQAEAAAEAEYGSDVMDQFDHIVFYYPPGVPDCSWAGLASVGGSRIWMRSGSIGTMQWPLD